MEKVLFVIIGIIMNGARPHQYGVAKKTSEAPRAGMEQGVGGKKRRSYPKITVSRAIPPSLEGRGLPRTGTNKTKTASTPEGTLAVVFDSAAIGCASVWKITEQTTERACLSVPAYPPVRQW